jgi:hypothetical protein
MNCHAKMDPIGFALENFDAVGAFRTKDGAFDVDATGEFSDGTKFAGPDELKSIVMNRKEEFTRCLVEKLLIYALGRGLEYYDRPTVEKIVLAFQADVTRVVTFVLANEASNKPYPFIDMPEASRPVASRRRRGQAGEDPEE